MFDDDCQISKEVQETLYGMYLGIQTTSEATVVMAIDVSFLDFQDSGCYASGSASEFCSKTDRRPQASSQGNFLAVSDGPNDEIYSYGLNTSKAALFRLTTSPFIQRVPTELRTWRR